MKISAVNQNLNNRIYFEQKTKLNNRKYKIYDINSSNLVSQLPPAQHNRHLLTFSNDTQKICSRSLLQNFLEQPFVRTYCVPSFKGFDIKKEADDFIKYQKAKRAANELFEYTQENPGTFILRFFNLDLLEGIQYKIDVFKDLTMKEIQYLSEGLHVIAVKRGCNHMCGHCYADAKPSNREMSYEDFHKIMDGFKTLRKRLHNIDIYGENFPSASGDLIFLSTELFYDSDCMDIVLKNNKGKEFDFTQLTTELYESMGRKSVFDTSGWYRNNTKMQKRAEKYAEFFSSKENMDMLNQFNISFNVFNASYIGSINALKKGNQEKAKQLRERYVSDMANVLFTFTPLLKSPKFSIIMRACDPRDKNTKYFRPEDMEELCYDVIKKLKEMYTKDLTGEQKHIKTYNDLRKNLELYIQKMSLIDTELNSSGRMQKFLKEHNIKSQTMQNHAEVTPLVIKEFKHDPRNAHILMQRIIDTDGRVYNMDYARFLKTEIQLNLEGKNTPTPKLANTVEDFVITKKNINK